MSGDNNQTALLLRRWQSGDDKALDALVERHLPWIEAFVRRRLGPLLRSKGETPDFVQDALVELLRYGPRFRVSNEMRFRALMARIVNNALCDKHDWYTARRRQLARERPLPPDSVLDLDPRRPAAESPSQALVRREREAWIRLGMELLDPGVREVIVLREWDGLPFKEIGEKLNTTPEAVRKRFTRAVGRLADLVDQLRHGEIDSVLAEEVQEATVQG